MAVGSRLTRRVFASTCLAIALVFAVAPGSSAGGSRGQDLRLRALRLGTAAYVYGFPLLAELGAIGRLPVNTFVHLGAPATPVVRLVVLANADTPYSTSHLDLRSGPVVLEVPSTGGRYYTMQLLDAYTNVFAYVGRRVTGTRAGRFVIVGPGWRGSLPSGLRRIDSPTPDAWILGRLLPRNPADLPAVRGLQRRFVLTTLSAYEARRAPTPPLVLPSPPAVVAPPIPRGLAFFDQLGQALQNDPPPDRDRQFLRSLTAVGIGRGLQPSHEQLASAVRAGLIEAAAAGPGVIRGSLQRTRKRSTRGHNGWLVFPSSVGRFGRAYRLRAVVAAVALAANVPREAIYPLAFTDRHGRTLSGGHSYVVHFAAGKLPPVDAFWSLTVYSADLFLTPNAINRYSIGDHTPGLRRNSDGSLDVFLQLTTPRRGISNWLPVPVGRFVLALRLFQPRLSVLDGRWPLPTVSLVH